MSDVFHEVDEQMRADRARRLLIKFLPWAVSLAGAVIIATLIIWGWQAYQSQASAKASEAFQTGVKAYNAGDDEAASKAFADAAKAGSPNYKAMALMEQGQIAASAGKPAPEVAGYYDKAAKAATVPLLADLARLEAAYVLLDTAPYKDVEARLQPLTGEKSPYRAEAKEALAFAKMLNGDLAGARTSFNALMLNPDAADGVKQRAQAAMMIIDSGAAKTLPAVVKAQVAEPVQPRIPQSVLDAIAQQQQQQQQQAGPGAPPVR